MNDKKSVQEKVQTLVDGEWKIEHRDDGLSFISYPAFWSSQKEVWFGPFDRWVAQFILDAVKEKQERDRKL